MIKKRKKIPESLKSKILAEALVPGCRIADLAKTYGTSAWTIYTWRKEMNTEPSSTSSTSTKFVEAIVTSDKDANLGTNLAASVVQSSNSNFSSSSYYTRSTLQKASLTFKHFSCEVEGNISRGALLKIIEAIDESEKV